jgi:hypothetical protein
MCLCVIPAGIGSQMSGTAIVIAWLLK